MARGRGFPDRIVVGDIAPPGSPLVDLEILPEAEEGVIDLPIAVYLREKKRLSGRQKLAYLLLAAAIVAAKLRQTKHQVKGLPKRRRAGR